MMREKHGLLRKRYLESAPQNPQLFPTKITVNKTDIFDAIK